MLIVGGAHAGHRLAVLHRHRLLLAGPLVLLLVELLDEVGEEQLRRLREVGFGHVGDRDLDALLQHLLELLRRDRRGLSLLVPFLAQLHQHLHRLRLELAAEVHGLRALVGHRLALRHVDPRVVAQRLGRHRRDVQVPLAHLGPVLEQLRCDVRDAFGQPVKAQRCLGGVLYQRLRLLQRFQYADRVGHDPHQLLRPDDAVHPAQAGAHEVLDERLAHGQLVHFRASVQFARLSVAVRAADAAVLAADEHIDPGVLNDGEEVGRQPAVGEDVEEAFHVGKRSVRRRHLARSVHMAVGVDRWRWFGQRPFGLRLDPLRREDRAFALELEFEGAELKVAGLVRAVDLVDAEVLGLVLELLDVRRQEDRAALGGRCVALHPADPLFCQRLRRVNPDFDAGERLAVHAQDVGDTAQLDPRRERLQHILAAAGLHAEVGLAAVGALVEQRTAFGVPFGDRLDGDALERGRCRLQELHRRQRRALHELFRQREQQSVGLLVNLRQRA